MKVLRLGDLFCGAGGTTTGAVEAIEFLGYKPEVTAINHKKVCIDTHMANHPLARHLCTNIDDVDPLTLFREGELDVLWASPECTHHSIALGGRPMNDQKRCSAWCVTRFMQTLRPRIVLVENVPEFAWWGGLMMVNGNWRPDPALRSQSFLAWMAAGMSFGYKAEKIVLTAADYGDPTTRRRLFVQFQLGASRRVVWPHPTHGPGTARAHVTAADGVIDWKLEGESIFERKRGLVVKTILRILYGLEKYSLAPFLIPGKNESRQRPRTHDVKKPLPVVTATGHIDLIKTAFVVKQRGTSQSHLESSAQSVDKGLDSVSAGGLHHGLAATFLVQTCHGDGKDLHAMARRVKSVESTLPTVCGERGDFAKVSVMLSQQSGGVARPVEEQVPTIATGGKIGKVDYIISIDHQGGNGMPVRDVKSSLSNVTTKQRHSILSAFLVAYYGTMNVSPADALCPTVTTKERFGLNRPRLELVEAGEATFRRVDYFAWKRLVTCQARRGKRLTRLFMQFDDQIAMLEITHRMLQVHELAAAQGFRKNYKFCGNKTEQVRQIGNAVPRNLARAIVMAAVSQNPAVEFLG